MASRVQRFSLQSAAREILPKTRTAKCLRLRTGRTPDVQVWKSKAHHTTSYRGLQTCGSVWACPVCAAKIAERRRIELLEAMEMHKAQGGAVSLLTLTTPHQRGDNLAVLLEQQGNALQGFLRDRKVKEVFSEMGYLGQVRALEVTHGRRSDRNNGWHPHFHILQFHQVAGREADRKDWTARLYLRWVVYCEKAGLGTPSYRHGIKLDDGTKASQYVTKWGLEDEMTRGHTKKAKAGGETPFDLLRAFTSDRKDSQAAALFREFAECFRGKRQLSWSNGLKARFYVDDKSDEELAEEAEDNAFLLGQITLNQWRDVLKVDGRGTVLEIAARSSWEAVTRYLSIIDGASEGVFIDPEILQEAREILMVWV